MSTSQGSNTSGARGCLNVLLWVAFFPIMLTIWAFRKNRILGFAVILLLIVSLVSMGRNQEGAGDAATSATGELHSEAPVRPSNTSGSTSQPAAAIESPPKEKVATVGETVQVGHFAYKVVATKFAKSVGSEYSRQTADGIYLVIQLGIRNDSNKPHTLDGSMFKLFDAAGREFGCSSDASTALVMVGQETIFLKECQPGITTSGLLPFEVPSSDGPYILRVSGGFWTGETADIAVAD